MKKKSNMLFTMIITLFVIISLFALIIINKKENKKEIVNESTSTSNQVSGLKDIKNINTEGQPHLGKKNAKVKIIEFGDYKCPACKYFDMEILPQIKKKYIDTGKAEFYFIHTPFHGDESLFGDLAGETVLKQHPNKYWTFHEAIFKIQPNINNVWLNMSAVKQAAKTAGIKDIKALESSILASKQLNEVNKDISLVKKHNIKVTPTIIINGKEVKNQMNLKEIESNIEKELK